MVEGKSLRKRIHDEKHRLYDIHQHFKARIATELIVQWTDLYRGAGKKSAPSASVPKRENESAGAQSKAPPLLKISDKLRQAMVSCQSLNRRFRKKQCLIDWARSVTEVNRTERGSFWNVVRMSRPETSNDACEAYIAGLEMVHRLNQYDNYKSKIDALCEVLRGAFAEQCRLMKLDDKTLTPETFVTLYADPLQYIFNVNVAKTVIAAGDDCSSCAAEVSKIVSTWDQ